MHRKTNREALKAPPYKRSNARLSLFLLLSSRKSEVFTLTTPISESAAAAAGPEWGRPPVEDSFTPGYDCEELPDQKNKEQRKSCSLPEAQPVWRFLVGSIAPSIQAVFLQDHAVCNGF